MANNTTLNTMTCYDKNDNQGEHTMYIHNKQLNKVGVL